MSILFSIENLKDNAEIIICDSEAAKQAHKELFRFSDNVYLITDGKTDVFGTITSIIDSCNSSLSYPLRIHLVINWKNLLHLSLWQASEPITGEVFTLLKNNGVGSQELQPFRSSDIDDIFPWLYYGKRFDVLRKICHIAKRKVQDSFKGQHVHVDCHTVAEDTKKIVASSL